MLLVHKIELKVNNKQATYFAKACGVARFAYNWALGEWQKQYKAGQKPNEINLRKYLNSIKSEQFPWMLEVTKVAPQQAIKNLGTAFQRFFNHQGKYPKFKKKGIHDSFRADNGPAKVGSDAVRIIDKKMKLPRIGWVRLKEKLRFTGQVKSVVISRRANRWYAGISVDTTELNQVRKNQGIVGVDLGIKTLATLSTGEQIVGPRAHKQLLTRLRKYSKKLSRCKKGSKSYKKARLKLSKTHAKIRDIRIDNLHKLTTDLALRFNTIGIEDLNINGMVRNKKLARHIMDGSFYEFRRQLEYKAKWYGSTVVVVGRFYPSSKLCHCCNCINQELKLSDRQWRCSNCNKLHDRDINAAINIANYARHADTIVSTQSSCGIYVCGEKSADAAVNTAA